MVGRPERTYAVIETWAPSARICIASATWCGGKVVEVTRNRVAIDNRGRREELFSFEKTDSRQRSRQASRPHVIAEHLAIHVALRSPPRETAPIQRRKKKIAARGRIEIERVSENVW